MSEKPSDIKVSVRDLQRNASTVLHRIEEGATVTVTRHGRSIARIVPPDPVDEAVEKAIADGLLDASQLHGAWSAAETARLSTPSAAAAEEPLSATLERLRDEDGDR